MSVRSAPLEGRCSCGAVRYRMEAPPLFVHCCHCTWCQRETGSAFALNAMVERDRLSLLQGAPEEVLTPSESGKGQRILRCPHCRVALWSHYPGGGEAIAFVRVGTLETAHALRPDVHIYTASKQAWVVLDDGAPAFEAFYDPKQQWAPETMQRYRDAKSRPEGKPAG